MEARAASSAHRVRHDQLVRVALLLDSGPPPWTRVCGVGDRAVQRRPAGAEAERGHHQPRVAEHLLGLDQALAFDAADQPVGADITLSRNSAAVLLSRIPCLSSGLPS